MIRQGWWRQGQPPNVPLHCDGHGGGRPLDWWRQRRSGRELYVPIHGRPLRGRRHRVEIRRSPAQCADRRASRRVHDHRYSRGRAPSASIAEAQMAKTTSKTSPSPQSRSLLCTRN